MNFKLNLMTLLLFYNSNLWADQKTMTQQKWLKQFEGFFIEGLCEKKDYVKTCLHSSSSACKMNVADAMNACVKKIKLPLQMPVGIESEKWGEQLGRCIAPQLISKTTKEKEDPKCQTLNAW